MRFRAIEQWPKGRWHRVAKAAACPVFLAHKESQERAESLANQEHLDRLDSLAVPHWKFAKSSKPFASHARQVQQALEAHLALTELPDQTAPQAAQEKTAPQDKQANLEKEDNQDNPEKTETKEHQVIQRRLFQQHPEIKVKGETTARQDLLDQVASQDKMDHQARKVLRVHPATLEHQAKMALLATKAQQVPTDPRESQVFAPNTAPPTEVSSSKTAPRRLKHPTTASSIDSPKDHGIRTTPPLLFIRCLSISLDILCASKAAFISAFISTRTYTFRNFSFSKHAFAR